MGICGSTPAVKHAKPAPNQNGHLPTTSQSIPHQQPATAPVIQFQHPGAEAAPVIPKQVTPDLVSDLQPTTYAGCNEMTDFS